ncbi:hypothetical protein ILYODFUR_011451 [Ilyodon furcidens]|uniref:Uncharacterized protein n=1 Tax=Ilyodon furcidens TaxID=33524 RepID=A0ABV0SW33_9TELE
MGYNWKEENKTSENLNLNLRSVECLPPSWHPEGSPSSRTTYSQSDKTRKSLMRINNAHSCNHQKATTCAGLNGEPNFPRTHRPDPSSHSNPQPFLLLHPTTISTISASLKPRPHQAATPSSTKTS